MSTRLTLLTDEELWAALARVDAGTADRSDRRAVTKHLLAVLVARSPGRSVEVRVPPYAVVQCVAGPRHTRGTPPAVVEMPAEAWIAVATGRTTWAELVEAGRIHASGERSDLSGLLPLVSAGPPDPG